MRKKDGREQVYSMKLKNASLTFWKSSAHFLFTKILTITSFVVPTFNVDICLTVSLQHFWFLFEWISLWFVFT